MPVPTLAGLCRRTIWANIDELSYVSTLPYWKVRDILKQVKSASQLAVIEEYSPQIVGEDAELWEAFCKRDFRVPMKRKDYQPENPRSWRQVYERYAEEEREAEALALEQLGATYAGLNKMKMANKTSIGDPRHLPKAPTNGAFGRSRGKGPGPGSATLSFGGGARTTNAVRKAKKEALEVAARKRLSVPKTMRPSSNLAKVMTAPESMKAEFRIKAQPKFIPPTTPAVAKRPREMDDERGQMESRLLAAKRPKVQPKLMSDDELRSSSSKLTEGGKLAATSASEPRTTSTPKRPRGLFSRTQNTSQQQGKVTIKTVGKPTSNAAPEKTRDALKSKASLPGSVATTHSSSSTGKSAPAPVERLSRPGTSRINAVARRGDEMSTVSRVSSPGCEDFKLSKMAPRRASRSPSVTSSIFGSPEPDVPGARGRRSPLKSDSSRSSSPLAAPLTRPAKRARTPPTAATVHEGNSSSPPKRKLDEAAAGGPSAAATSAEGGTAVQPPVKKKKVDIFMRRKR